MANDSKYVRLYPEAAVAPLRTTARRLLDFFAVNDLPAALCELEGELDRSLADLDDEGFPPDEPLFLLRGQDELAPDTLREYIRQVEREEGAFSGDRLAVVNHLYEFVTRMEQWTPRKLPD